MTENVLYFLIFIIITSLIKGLLNAIEQIDTVYDIVGPSYKQFNDMYDHILDILYLYIGYYILLVMKKPSWIYILTAIVFMQKGILHFVAFFEWYKKMGLSPEAERIFVQYKEAQSFVTNYGLLFVSAYMLRNIFKTE